MQEIKEDGSHMWNLQHFDEPTYCNVCQDLLVTWKNKQGLVCACEFCNAKIIPIYAIK